MESFVLLHFDHAKVSKYKDESRICAKKRKKWSKL